MCVNIVNPCELFSHLKSPRFLMLSYAGIPKIHKLKPKRVDLSLWVCQLFLCYLYGRYRRKLRNRPYSLVLTA